MAAKLTKALGRTMTPREQRLFREVYHYNGLTPGPFLVDGPRRCKMATSMSEVGWLDDHGDVGTLGRAYRVTAQGIDAHNAALTHQEKDAQDV